MTDQDIFGQWRADLEFGAPGVQLVDVDHPLEVYVGASDLIQARVQIRSAIKPKMPSLSDLVLVDRSQHGGTWLLTLTLQDPRFNDVFVRLSKHLIERSLLQPDERSAWLAIDDVLDTWQRLLRPRPPGVLSLEALRGLVGELWLVKWRFAGVHGIAGALSGWLGPMGSPQDFWFEGSGYHESKSIGPTSTVVKISSAEQLDAEPLELLVLRVPQVAETTAGALNLPRLVQQVKTLLDEEGVPSAELDLRLSRLGVDVDHPYYTDLWFIVTTVETFNVTQDFPALRAIQLPVGLSRVRYNIDLVAMAPYLSSSEAIK